MRKIVIAIIGIIVIVIAVFAFSLVFLVPGHYVGYAVRVQGNYAYVADSAGVTILDVSEPSRSSVISNLAFAHGALGIQVKNSLAFIATDSEGFAIADISDPNNPIKLGKYGETALEVCIDGSYAYITIRDVGLQILDIKNPELITKVGELNGLGRGDDVEVHQGIVYYADGSSNQDSLKVINVTDPSAPQKIKDIAGIAGVFDIHICEDANLLFLACHSFGVRIMNISNPQSPSVISSYIKTDGEAYGVSGNSTHLYVADLQQGAYLLDITNPTSPVEVASYNNAAPHGIFSDGEFIYLADQDNGLIILDSGLAPVYGGYTGTPGFDFPFVITGLVLFLIMSKWKTKK